MMLKEKFPKQCDWEKPKWAIIMMREDFEKKCKSDQGRGNVDTSEDTKRGLYSKSSPCLNAIDDHWMSKIDI